MASEVLRGLRGLLGSTERAKALSKCWASRQKRPKLANKMAVGKDYSKNSRWLRGRAYIIVYIIYIYTYNTAHISINAHVCVCVGIYMYVNVVRTPSQSRSARRFSVGFKKTMAFQPRVIKQNRGSSGPVLLSFQRLSQRQKAPFFIFVWGGKSGKSWFFGFDL